MAMLCCPFVRHTSSVQKILSPETAWPIKAKLHVEHPLEGRKKDYINATGQRTKMAAMPIYGKNYKKNLPNDLEMTLTYLMAGPT